MTAIRQILFTAAIATMAAAITAPVNAQTTNSYTTENKESQQQMSARETIYRDHNLSGCMYRAYPEPTKQLTPAPAGKKPFYISHYGRHGSRWLIGRDSYSGPMRTLEKADSAKELTAYGKEVLKKLRVLTANSNRRLGELTSLGAQQHRRIGGRMADRFPEVFEGHVRIEARSSTVIRCILSMENELLEMMRRHNDLKIWSDASDRDMWFVAGGRENLGDMKGRKNGKELKQKWFASKMPLFDSFFKKLFKSQDYVDKMVNKERLIDQLWSVAVNMQSLDERKEMSLDDLFDSEQYYTCYANENGGWFINYGSNLWTEGKMPYSQRFLLRDFITKADSCIALPKPGATLRFGHDTMVCPLVCLLGIGGRDKILDETDFDNIAEKWRMYEFVPMAANIQFIFYRSSPSDGDVLVKVLLNENEVAVTEDIKTDIFPYYHWKDFRDYFMKKLGNFQLR